MIANHQQAFLYQLFIALRRADYPLAGRGTDKRLFYPWGNKKPTKQLANIWPHVKDTSPVGQYPKGKSKSGCLDMAGNVWEWTLSKPLNYPYKPDDGRENTSRTYDDRVLRGGSWNDDGTLPFSVFFRYRHDPRHRDNFIGFRLARSW